MNVGCSHHCFHLSKSIPLHPLHPLAALAHEFCIEVVRDEEHLRGREVEDEGGLVLMLVLVVPCSDSTLEVRERGGEVAGEVTTLVQ